MSPHSKNCDQVFTITSNECFTLLWGNFGSLFAEFFFFFLIQPQWRVFLFCFFVFTMNDLFKVIPKILKLIFFTTE